MKLGMKKSSLKLKAPFNIENYLHKIDKAFEDKDEKEILMIYVMIFAGLFALSYLLFWDSAEKGFKSAHERVVATQNKINADKSYLNANPPGKIVAIENDTKRLKSALGDMQKNNEYITMSIEKISELFYDEESWGAYINSISKNAKAEKIKLLELSNSFSDSNESFGHVLDITIKASGKYKNMLKFIDRLERSDLVVDIHDLDMAAKEQLVGDINISVWGITYR